MPLDLPNSQTPGNVPGPLHDGMRLTCPTCRQETIVKRRSMIEDWEAKGYVFVCGLCQTELGRADDDAAGSTEATNAREPVSDSSRGQLATLFGEDAPPSDREPARHPLLDEEKAHFCKDCRHFWRHAFQSNCLLHECSVDPMGDCPDFAVAAETDENGKETA